MGEMNDSWLGGSGVGGFGTGEFSMGETAEVCEQFQLDLSCLVDGELDEPAAGRALLHIECCDCCREFFDDTRRCLRLHVDSNDPQRLLARITSLTGNEIATSATAIELVHKLATIFYQLGKAYVLLATDPGYRTRVFEAALPIEPTQTRGRGFVDGVLLGGGPATSGATGDNAPARTDAEGLAGEIGGSRLGAVDWDDARGILNGRLKEIDSPLEKGRRLLQEAIAADPSHEEARLYLAFLLARDGKSLQAAKQFRGVFDGSMQDANRGHAAIQLGLLHEAEGDHRRALTFFRWVSLSGLERRDARFFFVLFNIGLQYALLGDQPRSLRYFRRLFERHPERRSEVAHLIATSPRLHEAIEARVGFAQAFANECRQHFDLAPNHLPPTDGEEPQS